MRLYHLNHGLQIRLLCIEQQQHIGIAGIELLARQVKADFCGTLEIARSPSFTLEKLREALARSAEIH